MEQQALSVHPLFDCIDHYSRTWADWKKECSTAETYDHKYILIRRGFYMEASDEEAIERLILYFQMAEGHLTGAGLENLDDSTYEYHPYPLESWPRKGGQWKILDLRKALAHQAYNELVYHFFRSRADNFYQGEDYQYPWIKWLKNRELMEALLYFFRLEDGKLPNYGSEHDDEKRKREFVKDALVNLCGAKWRIGIPSITKDWSEYALAENANKFLEILFGLGKLDIFLKPTSDRWKYIKGSPSEPYPVLLEPSELAKLRELVLAEKTINTHQTEYVSWGVRRSIWRAPRSVEEALTTISETARIYVFICARQNVNWRP